MIRRLTMTLFSVCLVSTLAAAPALAHPGHEHKVLGTVTMAAADHVMLKDKDGKEVTIQIDKDTKVVKDKKAMKVADITAGMRVVVTAVTIKEKTAEKTAEKTIAKSIELGAMPAAK